MFKNLLYNIFHSFLWSIDAETAHKFALRTLYYAKLFHLTHYISKPIADPRIVMGLSFPNPIGLAAGFDKNGIYIDSLATLGFGSIEIGTVTPRPQFGNPKPRLFRLPTIHAIINSMGFNNSGVDACITNIQISKFYQEKQGILGLNIGKNFNTPMKYAVEDYLYCLKKVYPYANYIVINVSSPNTKDLCQLQKISILNIFLKTLKRAQQKLTDQYKNYVPLVLKISPDINVEQIKNIADILLQYKIDGIIATNTSIIRNNIKNMQYQEKVGGLSGAPVFTLSNQVIYKLKAELGDSIPIIGVGGILSDVHAMKKIEAGAVLVQLYTGLIYHGPHLILECSKKLRHMAKNI